MGAIDVVCNATDLQLKETPRAQIGVDGGTEGQSDGHDIHVQLHKHKLELSQSQPPLAAEKGFSWDGV